MRFFMTGNSVIKSDVNLDFIAPVNLAGGGGFTSKGQTLQQSYLIAQNIFQLSGKNKVNLVLIGLSADVLFRDEDENFSRKIFDENIQALEDYINLCLKNGTQPVGVIFPFAPSVREDYRKKFLNPLLNILSVFEELYSFRVINFFDMDFSEDNFSDEFHLNKKGAMTLSLFLTLKLHEAGIFSTEYLCRMNYSFFFELSYEVDKNFFQSLMKEIFSCSVKNLRRKDKIKVGFVLEDTSRWCGNKLYNLFVQDPRYEPTVFFYLEKSLRSNLRKINLEHGFRQLKSAGINVVGVIDGETEIPKQDILIFLIPYPDLYPRAFRASFLTAETLMIYIPYSLEITLTDIYVLPVYYLSWKIFCETKLNLLLTANFSKAGKSNLFFSGSPKMDIFFEKDKHFHFAWKMTRPDAKKIIWAPHWSINDITGYATFQWNYQFMYEFAKAHPETSWVVKPHPGLLDSVIKTGLFPSEAAFAEYLQKWNELPNAQVYVGAYYQSIFATSDGMILDSCSFMVEYQYTHKPMIYLIFEKTFYGLNDLGNLLMNVIYTVDGKNFTEIASAIQKIFIEGNDPLKEHRRKVFDEELNYYRINGMDASDFIFKNVAQELELSV